MSPFAGCEHRSGMARVVIISATPLPAEAFSLALTRSTRLGGLALLALPVALLVVGDDAQALFVARRGLCFKLSMPIGAWTKQHRAQRQNRRCWWWPGQDRSGFIAVARVAAIVRMLGSAAALLDRL